MDAAFCALHVASLPVLLTVGPRDYLYLLICYMPVPVAARSTAWVCGRSPAQFVGSNPSGGMDVCLLRVSCVVRQRSLRRADHSSRGVLPTVVRRCV